MNNSVLHDGKRRILMVGFLDCIMFHPGKSMEGDVGSRERQIIFNGVLPRGLLQR
jgi:hypothetical protein